MIRVLIIDDSAYIRRSLKAMLESSGNVRVIGTARDGEEGLMKAFELKPDAVTLDLEMPKMDGLTFLRILLNQQPTPVIVVSSRKEDATVFKALELGAVDFIPKPTHRASPELYNLKDDLLGKILALGSLNLTVMRRHAVASTMNPDAVGDRPPRPRVKERRDDAEVPGSASPFRVVAIGSSTGGPSALQKVLSMLPDNINAAVAVSQHMPPGFTRAFAERLDRYTTLQVKEAEPGDLLLPGRILIAPGGFNLIFHANESRTFVVLRRRRADDRYVPSVDAMFRSAAQIFGDKLLGIVLTGMGSDGVEGLKEIKRRGGKTLAESPESAVIFGMPKEAIESGAVDKVAPLAKISQEIIGWVCGKDRL